MDFFKDDKKDTKTAAHGGEHHGGEHHKKSSAELLSSAKLVAEAAQSGLHNEPNKIDKGKVAGAAADLLEAAEEYGKLGEGGVGKYIDQAEAYLHKYSHSATAHTGSTTGHAATHAAGDGHGAAHSKPESGADHEKSGSDYLKMAQGFLGKH